MSKKALIFTIIAVVIATGVLIVYKIWNKPFKNVLSGDAVKVTATELFNDFKTNESAAINKYVVGDKVVEISGNVKEIGKNDSTETYYYLDAGDSMSGLKCTMDKGIEIKDAKVGSPVVIRGFCNGAKKDTIMDIPIMDIIVNRCKAIK